MTDIEYFYSAHSAFAYLGSRRLMEIAAAAGARIIHRPYDLRRGILGIGVDLSRDRTPAHRAYFFGREIARWSEHRDAPVLTGRPRHHDNDIRLPNCMLIAAQSGTDGVDRLAHAMLQAHWRDDADLADAATLTRLADTCGLDGAALLATARTPDINAIYDSNTDEAIRRSVFGSPTYFVGGDMFYGQDHLEMVERALARPYAGTWRLPD